MSEEGNVIVRDVGFKEGFGGTKVREIVKEFAPIKVYLLVYIHPFRGCSMIC